MLYVEREEIYYSEKCLLQLTFQIWKYIKQEVFKTVEIRGIDSKFFKNNSEKGNKVDSVFSSDFKRFKT